MFRKQKPTIFTDDLSLLSDSHSDAGTISVYTHLGPWTTAVTQCVVFLHQLTIIFSSHINLWSFPNPFKLKTNLSAFLV
jgi:hypothetical protein